jgi:hypothetical protein
MDVMARLRTVAAMAALLTVAVLGPSPASAGGSPFKFERESYLPGDAAAAEAPFGPGCCGRGWIEDGPYAAYMQQLIDGRAVGERIPVGEVSISEEEYFANGQTFTRLVARVAFVVPDVAFGSYVLGHCNEGCVTELGEVTGGFFWVGPPGGGASDAVVLQPRLAG